MIIQFIKAFITITLQIISFPNGLQMVQLEKLYLHTTLRNSRIGPQQGILVKSTMAKYS